MRDLSVDARRRVRRFGSICSVVLALLCPLASNAQAGMAISLERGAGDGTGLWRIGLQRDWREWTLANGWNAMVAWEVQLGRWDALSGSMSHHPLSEIGITPIVRLERPASGSVTAFVEGAVGAHLISRNRVHSHLDMSSAYQFGDHLGVGVRFGHTPWLEVIFRHQHLSNASTVQPNDGVNFNILRVVYYLQ